MASRVVGPEKELHIKGSEFYANDASLDVCSDSSFFFFLGKGVVLYLFFHSFVYSTREDFSLFLCFLILLDRMFSSFENDKCVTHRTVYMFLCLLLQCCSG